MSRCIGIGIDNFVLNMKRKNFVIASLIFLCALGVYIFRHQGEAEISNGIASFAMCIFNYFIMFVACYIVAADSRNGMDRIIYTSSLSKFQVMGYKYVTTIMTGIWFWGLITVFQVVLLVMYPSGDAMDAVIKNIITNLAVILFSTIHITSLIMLLAAIFKSYMITLIVTFLSYALLTYFYQLYVFLAQQSVKILELIPMILVNALTNTRRITTENLGILLTYTIVFTVIAYALQKKLDMD